jgi:hypothetical protein
VTGPGAGALADVERVVAGGGEADDVVREVVAILHERLGRFVRLSFVEDGGLVAGPAAGVVAETAPFPVRFQGMHVADLEVGGEPADADRALVERVAELVAQHALVAWDTGGEAWES